MSERPELDALLEAIVASLGGRRREGQERMAHAVADALEDEGHLLVQAGTGTGKSIGYLAPAMAWAVEGGHRVVVSTATLALQRQIVTKDAPLVAEQVAEATGQAPIVKVLKGWSNYACMRKVYSGEVDADALISSAEAKYGATATGEEVVRAREWAKASETGDRDDLVPGVDGRVWAQISTSKPECIGDKCPHAKECFARSAREEAAGADIVVTNHALLTIQATGTPVLPEAEAYIVDEAHELADRATAQLTATMSAGDLRALARLLRKERIVASEIEDWADSLEDILDALPEERLEDIPAGLHDVLVALRGSLQEAADDVSQLKGDSEKEAASKNAARSRLRDLIDVIDQLLSDGIAEGSLVPWISRSNQDRSYLSVAPLDVAAALADGLFCEMPAVLTSATLALGDSFDHAARQVGFSLPSQGPWTGLDVGSPFDPSKQGILYVASDLPEPGRGPMAEKTRMRMLDLIEASRGGALCLFTSWAAAQDAAEEARAALDFPILVQGEENLPQLIEEFRADEEACLFGTRSLWQGVDVPGLTNRLVIIDRIPFPPPSDPLIEARSIAARKARLSDFAVVSMPAAALLLAQGAGRLLRADTDRGVVALLDSRITSRRYGSYMRAAMPAFWYTEDFEVASAALGRLAEAAFKDA